MIDPARIEEVKRLALAWLHGGEYVTDWAIGEPEFAEGEEEGTFDSRYCTIVAQDLGHHSNVIVLEIEDDGVISAN